VKRPLWWMLALSLTALAALAATPPNLPKALAAQRQLAEKQPQDASVQNDLGNLLLLSRRPDEAEAAYRRALELDPKRTSALFNLGLLEEGKGHLKEALKLYRQVVEIEPQHAWAHYQIGSVYEAQGKKDAAVDEYAHAFALNPQLAFPDVNPHVVGSRLVTESMLRGYRESALPPQAPKAYEDPRRIAAILVNSPPPAAAAASDQVAGQANPTLRPQAAAPGAGGRSTVLRPGNLPRGESTGQALPPGTQRRPPGTGAGTVQGGYRAGQPGNLRSWPRPDPNLPNSNLDAEDDEEGQVQQAIPQIAPPPNVRLAPPPTGVYYQPGLPSSGRLEIKLLPAPSARLAANR